MPRSVYLAAFVLSSMMEQRLTRASQVDSAIDRGAITHQKLSHTQQYETHVWLTMRHYAERELHAFTNNIVWEYPFLQAAVQKRDPKCGRESGTFLRIWQLCLPSFDFAFGGVRLRCFLPIRAVRSISQSGLAAAIRSVAASSPIFPNRPTRTAQRRHSARGKYDLSASR